MTSSLAAITTDTGPLAPGHATFARYVAPGACVAAARAVRDVQRRTVEAQLRALRDSLLTVEDTHASAVAVGPGTFSAQHAFAFDTLPTRAVSVARACGARFTLASVDASEFRDFFDLALLERNDALAHDVLERRIALASSAAARDSVMLIAIAAYLSAQPAHVAAADTVRMRVDTGAASGLSRLAALRANMLLLQFAFAGFDRPRVQQLATRILAIGHGNDTTQQYSAPWIVLMAYKALMQVMAVEHADSLTALAQRVQRDLMKIPVHPRDWPVDFGATSPEVIVAELLDRTPRAVAGLGQPIDTLSTPYLFAASGPTSSPNALTAYVLMSGFGPYPQDARLYEQMRHWHELYGSRLVITVVVRTQGFWLMDRPTSGPQTAAEEAERIRTTFQDYLKLPANVAVLASSTQRRPDGGLVTTPAPFISKYQVGYQSVLLADERRRLLYLGDITPQFQALLANAAARTSAP